MLVRSLLFVTVTSLIIASPFLPITENVFAYSSSFLLQVIVIPDTAFAIIVGNVTVTLPVDSILLT